MCARECAFVFIFFHPFLQQQQQQCDQLLCIICNIIKIVFRKYAATAAATNLIITNLKAIIESATVSNSI